MIHVNGVLVYARGKMYLRFSIRNKDGTFPLRLNKFIINENLNETN